MIRINYCRTGDRHRLAVEGHAGQDQHGKDIVCAGVSAVSFALVGYLAQCDADIESLTGYSGNISIDCTGGERVEAAFDMALAGYLQISKHYPQYVNVYIASIGG